MIKPLIIALLAVVIGSLSCDSPTEPPAEGRVSVDRVIEGTLSTTDSTDRYTFLAVAGHTYSVSFEAVSGWVALYLRDSVSNTALVGGSDPSGGSGLEENVTLDLRPDADQVITLEISGVLYPVTYRVRINDVPSAPEGRAARFVFGDTVSEALSSSFDVDEYVAAGQAGQEVATLIEAFGPAFSGQVLVEVFPPGSTDALTSSGAVPGFPEGTNLERVILPATGDYRFVVFGLGTANQRYTGPYKLRVVLVHRSPESINAAVPLNTVVSGEAMDDVGDVDEFTFPGTAGQWVNAFIQSTSASPLLLEVFGAATDTGPNRAFSNPADTSLFKIATGRFRTLASTNYGLRVQNPALPGSTAPYRLFVYPINPAPESIAAAIVPGDTIGGESIERAGDFDEFTISGAVGDEYNLLFQNLSGHGVLKLEVWLPVGVKIADVTSAGTDTSLRQTTGRIMLGTTTPYPVRVMGVNSSDGVHTGPYRFFLYPVDPRPELGPDTLAFGDSVFTETIEAPGDRDEWTVTVPDSSGANLVLQLGSDAQGGPMQVELSDSAGVVRAATNAVSAANGYSVPSRVTLAPGRYTLRADPSRYNQHSVMTGSYRIWLYRFKIGPETAPDSIAIGDTVSEVSAPPGDVDTYHFFGTSQQHVRLALQGMSGQAGAYFLLHMGLPGAPPIGFLESPVSSGSLDENQTNRIDLPVTGWYNATVWFNPLPGPGYTDPGLYRFTIKPFSTLPENVPEALAVGDSVVAEALDSLGDWDEYVVAATPGSELAVLFYKTATQGFPRMMAFDPVTGDTLITMAGSSGVRGATPFVVPVSGQVRVSVSDAPPFYSYTGGYYLRVMSVNRAPEVASAGFAIGDTVRGEALAPLTDIDEFNGTGTPGQTLRPAFRLLADPQPAGRVITLEVVDPSTGNVLVGNNAGLTGSTSTFFSPGTFVVPAGGAYSVRIRAGALTPEDVATAPYEFFVQAGP